MNFPPFETIKMLYQWGALYPSVEKYVESGKITTDQYKELTGKDYVNTTGTAPTSAK